MSNNYWAERQVRTQRAITNKTEKEINKQLTKYYKTAMVNVVGEFESTYNKLMATISEGKEGANLPAKASGGWTWCDGGLWTS